MKKADSVTDKAPGHIVNKDTGYCWQKLMTGKCSKCKAIRADRAAKSKGGK